LQGPYLAQTGADNVDRLRTLGHTEVAERCTMPRTVGGGASRPGAAAASLRVGRALGESVSEKRHAACARKRASATKAPPHAAPVRFSATAGAACTAPPCARQRRRQRAGA
jgi:hypothetical protein